MGDIGFKCSCGCLFTLHSLHLCTCGCGIKCTVFCPICKTAIAFQSCKNYVTYFGEGYLSDGCL